MKTLVCSDLWRDGDSFMQQAGSFLRHIWYSLLVWLAVQRRRPMFRNALRLRDAEALIMLRECENGSEAETAFRTNAAADGKPLFIMNIYMPEVRQAAAASRTAAGAYLRELVTDRLESIVEPVGA